MPEEDDTVRPLSDRVVMELTAHRTLALRDAVANSPEIAFQAVLHNLCLGAFYHRGSGSCLEITARQSGFTAQAPGLAETASAKAIEARHTAWESRLPERPAELWETLGKMTAETKAALFAHCASLTVNVVKGAWNQGADALAHGEQLATAVGLDMAAAGWTPTVDNYLGRVPKNRIVEAVRAAKGAHTAHLIASLKKADMAREAERLLAGTGWLPEPLQAIGVEATAEATDAGIDADVDAALPDFLAGDCGDIGADHEVPHMIAAE